MTKEKLERIKELAEKKRTVGLSDAELSEQQELYREYLANFRANMTGILDNTYIKRPDGKKERLKKKS